MRGKIAADYDGTTPHPDPRREQFAQLVARGSAQSVAYIQAVARGDIKGSTARSNGLKVSRQPAVMLRVAALRVELTEARKVEDRDLTRSDIVALLGAVTSSYELAIETLELAGGNPSTLARLRSDLVQHLGRLNRVAPPKLTAPVVRDDTMIADALARLPICRCADARHGVTAGRTAP